MRAFTVIMAILFALATVPASAEERQTTARSDAQKKEDKEVDAAYRNATRGGPSTAAKVDPWGKVRPAESDKKPK
jgi:cell division protein FtsL